MVGQQSSGQDASVLVREMLTTLVQRSDQIPPDKLDAIQSDFRPIHSAFLQAGGLTPSELSAQKTNKIVSGATDTRLPQPVQHWVSDVLNVLDTSQRTSDQRFQQACTTAITQLMPLFNKIGLQVPAQASAYATASGIPGRHGGQEQRPGTESRS